MHVVIGYSELTSSECVWIFRGQSSPEVALVWPGTSFCCLHRHHAKLEDPLLSKNLVLYLKETTRNLEWVASHGVSWLGIAACRGACHGVVIPCCTALCTPPPASRRTPQVCHIFRDYILSLIQCLLRTLYQSGNTLLSIRVLKGTLVPHSILDMIQDRWHALASALYPWQRYNILWLIANSNGKCNTTTNTLRQQSTWFDLITVCTNRQDEYCDQQWQASLTVSHRESNPGWQQAAGARPIAI